MFDRISRGALGAALIALLAACSEQVTTSAGCPELCSSQSKQLRDTVLIGSVVQDSTIAGFPLFGSTVDVTMVSRGDTADVRAVARYDTLPNVKPSGDTITVVDSAQLVFAIDTTTTRPMGPVQVDAFDVDTTADDVGAVIPLYRPDRLLGSKLYSRAQLTDTLHLPLDNGAVLARIRGSRRLRVGLRISPTTPGQLRIAATTLRPIIRFRPGTDTTVAFDTVVMRSTTPSDPATASALTFYPVIVSGALPPAPSSLVAIGGIAGARSYLRFNVPDFLIDSVQVVRSTVQLQQIPSRSPGGNADTLSLTALAVVASSAQVKDLYTLSGFTIQIAGPALSVVPRDSGLKELELGTLVRLWRQAKVVDADRAIFLRVSQERVSPGELNFFSSKTVNPLLRPRLRITYVPRSGFGLP